MDLAEPLVSLDENHLVQLAAEVIRVRKVIILGVRRVGLVAGWVGAADLAGGRLGECARQVREEEELDESASLDLVATATRLASLIDSILRAEVVQQIVELQRASAGASPELTSNPLATSISR